MCVLVCVCVDVKQVNGGVCLCGIFTVLITVVNHPSPLDALPAAFVTHLHTYKHTFLFHLIKDFPLIYLVFLAKVDLVRFL